MLVEDLKAGNHVAMLDHGFQEIVWVGQKRVDLHETNHHLRPVLIKQNAVADGIPEHDVRVSPSHRILIRGHKVQTYFGTNEVLVSAEHLVNADDVGVDTTSRSVDYFHILFEQHEIITTSGLMSESFHPGHVGMSALDIAACTEVFELFPELARRGLQHYGHTARQVLKKHEAQLLHAHSTQNNPLRTQSNLKGSLKIST